MTTQLVQVAVTLLCMVVIDSPVGIRRRAWDLTKDFLPRAVRLVPEFDRRATIVNLARALDNMIWHASSMSRTDRKLLRSMATNIRAQVRRGQWKASEGDRAKRTQIKKVLSDLAGQLKTRSETTNPLPRDLEPVHKRYKDALRTKGRACVRCGTDAHEPKKYCGACWSVQYCSVRCQRKHYGRHHRDVCKIRRAMLDEYADPKYREDWANP